MTLITYEDAAVATGSDDSSTDQPQPSMQRLLVEALLETNSIEYIFEKCKSSQCFKSLTNYENFCRDILVVGAPSELVW